MPWLLQFCAARAAFATMFTAWSAVLPLLRTDWQISAWQAGMVQSAYHVGFLLSLFSVGFLSDRYGARRVFLLSGVAAAASGLTFALLAGMALGWSALRAVPNVVHASPGGHGDRLLEVLRNRPAMLSIWSYAFHAWELLGLWAWLPAFLAAAAIAGGSAGTQAASLGATLAATTYLVAVAGSVLGGSLSDRFGRTAMTLAVSTASLVCSFSFGWMIGLPTVLLVAVAVFYNVTAVADSSIHSTTLTELTDPRYLGTAYSLRSVLGFGAGAVAPWVFGLVLDWGRAGDGLPDHVVWGLAWSTLGLGGLLGPVVIWRLRRMPEASKLAGGKC